MQAKVEALEKEKFETLKQTKQTQAETVSELICNDCDYKAFKGSELSLHMENVHVGSHENSHKDLDSSQGFRVCNRCNYEAEDRCELDGPFLDRYELYGPFLWAWRRWGWSFILHVLWWKICKHTKYDDT